MPTTTPVHPSDKQGLPEIRVFVRVFVWVFVCAAMEVEGVFVWEGQEIGAKENLQRVGLCHGEPSPTLATERDAK
jgi:hypothetical protein